MYTNDPRIPQVRLQVSGKVKGIISLSPTYVRFIGLEGQPLSESIRIKPLDGHSFAIKSIKMQRGEHLHYDLKPVGQDPAKNGYTLVVQNTMQSAGFYQDLIIIETDNARKPSLQIPISARIRENKSVGKQPAHD